MSRFTDYQVNAYKAIFDRFASPNGLGVEEFNLVMPLFGPALPPSQYRRLFDTHRAAHLMHLDLDAFLDCLSAFETDAKKMADDGKHAVAHFAKKKGRCRVPGNGAHEGKGKGKGKGNGEGEGEYEGEGEGEGLRAIASLGLTRSETIDVLTSGENGLSLDEAELVVAELLGGAGNGASGTANRERRGRSPSPNQRSSQGLSRPSGVGASGSGSSGSDPGSNPGSNPGSSGSSSVGRPGGDDAALVNGATVSLASRHLAWVARHHPPKVVEPLYRDIDISISGCRDLLALSSRKVTPRGVIAFNALDPFVTVSLGREKHGAHETNIAVQTTMPRWEQQFPVRVTFPSNKFSAVQEYIESEVLLFHVWDHDGSGGRDSRQWLASAQLPLRTAMRATQGIARASLPLRGRHAGAPGLASAPLLEISYHARAAAGIVEEFRRADGAVQHKYGSKWAADLDEFGLAGECGRAEMDLSLPGDLDADTVSEILTDRIDTLRSRFARRHFQITAPDEHNIFRFTSAFVHDLPSGMEQDEIVAAVSHIPGRVARIPIRGPVPLSAQVSSPALIAFNGFACDRDRAFLLCSLLRGAGIDAFVCLGTVGNQYTTGTDAFWVAVRAERADPDVLSPSPSSEKVSKTRTGGGSGGGGGDGGGSGKSERVPAMSLIDPRSGKTYPPSTHGKGCPLRRVGSLIGPDNVWINAQQDDRVGNISWNIDSRAEDPPWEPVLSESVLLVFGPVQPVYPSFPLPPAPAPPTVFEIRSFVGNLVHAVGQYRTSALGAPVTKFHRGACRVLQHYIAEHETCAPDDESAQDEIAARCDNAVGDALPAGVLYSVRAYPFEAAVVEIIVRQLIWTGILDCTVPGAAFMIGAIYAPRPFRQSSAWVSFGHAYAPAAAAPEDISLDGVDGAPSSGAAKQHDL